MHVLLQYYLNHGFILRNNSNKPKYTKLHQCPNIYCDFAPINQIFKFRFSFFMFLKFKFEIFLKFKFNQLIYYKIVIIS